MSWKKILFLCLSFVFVFGGVFGFGEKVLAETYTEAKMWYGWSSTDQTNGAKIVKNSSGDLFTQNSSGQVSPMTKWNNGSGKNAQTYYTTYDGKTGKNVYFKSANSSGTYDIVEGSSWDEIDARYFEYSARKEAVTESLNSTDTREQKAAQELAAEEQQRKADAEANANNNSNEITCGSGWESLNPYCWIAVFINNVILRIAALIAGISGLLFDKILDMTVINMATNLEINNANGFINIGWKVLRDIVNIMFIFVLLYIGIMTIVKGFESGTSKMIATVIVVALLINFSLFFTKIIIDSSNIVAVNFYSAIKNAADTDKNGTAWQGIAAVFIEKAGMGNIFGINNASGISRTAIIIQGLGGSALLLVLALVIFIASAMFIARYIILMVVLIASSAAIGSWILPSLKKSVYDKWWSALIGQAFFAPVFFLFLYITLLFIDKTVGFNDTGNGTWSTIFLSQSNPGNSINLVLNYCLIIGSFIGTIVISKSLSNMAGSGAGKITAALGGATMGAVAFGGRNTFGRLGKSWNSESRQEEARNATGLRRSYLLATSAVGAKMKKGSFDPRNAKGAGAILGTAGISAKDGWTANKGGIVSDDKKWKEFKEGARGTYSEDEIKTKQQEAADRAAAAGKYGITEARATHTAAQQSKTDLEAEETRIKSEKGKATKTEQERIQKRLEEIQKEKEEADKNIEKTAAAQDKAEKHVRKKALERFKNSKSDKDKVFEAAMKEIEKNKKAEEGGSDKPKPDKDKK